MRAVLQQKSEFLIAPHINFSVLSSVNLKGFEGIFCENLQEIFGETSGDTLHGIDSW